jgi:hypothetical protein
MSDDNDDPVDKLRKRLIRSMRSGGYTDYEIESRAVALEFLYTTFVRSGKNHWLSKQIHYLVRPDTMSNDEWVDYLDINWKLIGLYDDDNKEDIN